MEGGLQKVSHDIKVQGKGISYLVGSTAVVNGYDMIKEADGSEDDVRIEIGEGTKEGGVSRCTACDEI